MGRVTVGSAVPEATAQASAPPGRRLLGTIVALVIGVAVAAGLVVGLLVAWWAGVIAAAAAAGAVWASLVGPRLRGAEGRAVELVGPTRAASPKSEARLLNLVEGLAPAAGLPRPEVLVADDDAPNAVALGRDGQRGVIVLTTGLVRRLDRMQLEAVVADLLVQIRDGFSAAATLSLAFRPSRPPAAVPFGIADSRAVTLTRYPPALAGAIDVMAAGGPSAPRRSSPVLGPLWLVPPGDVKGAADRAEALRAL